jgi:hypothetical protein
MLIPRYVRTVGSCALQLFELNIELLETCKYYASGLFAPALTLTSPASQSQSSLLKPQATRHNDDIPAAAKMANRVLDTMAAWRGATVQCNCLFPAAHAIRYCCCAKGRGLCLAVGPRRVGAISGKPGSFGCNEATQSWSDGVCPRSTEVRGQGIFHNLQRSTWHLFSLSPSLPLPLVPSFPRSAHTSPIPTLRPPFSFYVCAYLHLQNPRLQSDVRATDCRYPFFGTRTTTPVEQNLDTYLEQ